MVATEQSGISIAVFKTINNISDELFTLSIAWLAGLAAMISNDLGCHA